MHLRLGGARADRAPGDQIGDVLGRDHVEELAAGRQAEFVDLDQHLARDAQAAIDIEAAIEPGIVDQPFPSDGGAGLFEIDPHHDLEAVLQPLTLGHQQAGILECCHRIVDRTRPDDHQQAVIHAVQDAMNRLTRLIDSFGRSGAQRKFAQQMRGR